MLIDHACDIVTIHLSVFPCIDSKGIRKIKEI